MRAVSHLLVKCLGTLVLFIVTLLLGILPAKIIRSAKHQRSQGKRKGNRRRMFIGCCNCFAGGVFFSVCLLDLLPVVRDKITQALHEVNVTTKFPLGESIAAIGFILMVVTEIIVHSMGKNTILMDHTHHHNQMEEQENEPLIHDDNNHQNYGTKDNGYVPSPRHFAIGADKNVTVPKPGELPDHVSEDSRPNTPAIDEEDVAFASNFSPRLHRSKSMKSIASVNTVVHSSFRMYILIMALSLHSLFEGLTVGLITDVDTLIQLLIALLLHKGIIAFAMGVKLVDGGLRAKSVIKGIILFAAMAPIGVGLGLAVLSSFSRVASLFCSGILQGLATGSFLYVTFFEILPEEFTLESDHKGAKVVSVTCGFLIIVGMCYYENRFEMMKKIVSHAKVATPTTTSMFHLN